MRMKTLCMVALLGCAMITGCGKTDGNEEVGNQTVVSEEATTEVTESETETVEGKDKVILMVSFGTSYNDSREATIGAIESAVAEQFGDYEVRRAFTSQIIIDKLEERDGLKIDNVTEALDKLVADGTKTLIVQPTHLMNGYEYDDVIAEFDGYKDKFESFAIGEPLLTSDEDFDNVVKTITENTQEVSNDTTAIVFMGHGSEHEANAVYSKMQDKLAQAGFNNYFVGTVEAHPSIEDVIKNVEAGNFTKVVLQPLMVVAGDHANNDMAGDEEDSWKTQLEAAGLEVECILRGLGEFEGIQNVYVQHVQEAINTLN